MSNISNLCEGTLLRNGTYRIVKFLGQGGFGCTYEAIFEKIGVHVAIKEFFPKSLCNRDVNGHITASTDSNIEFLEKLRNKFVDEARTLYVNQNIDGIVKVKDIFDENGTSYFVMDFVDGQSIQKMIDKNGPMSEMVALQIISEVGRTLQSVHDHNCLHLDIKPDNIIVGADKRPILIDFGVSKQYSEKDGCNTSTLMGYTPGFSPIEQLNSNVHAFTPATDIYALGATLYTMITGKTPPMASDILNDIETLDFPSNITPSTRIAIETAMQSKVKQRPQSVLSFLSMLHCGEEILTPSTKGFINNDTQLLKKITSKPSTPNTYSKTIVFGTVCAISIIIFIVVAYLLTSNHNTDQANTTHPTDTTTMPEATYALQTNQQQTDIQPIEQTNSQNTKQTEPNTNNETTVPTTKELKSPNTKSTQVEIPPKTTNDILNEAKRAYNDGLYNKALNLFQQINDNPIAQYYIGEMYRRGQGVTKDDFVALSWYQKAAEQGYADAQTILGQSYLLGGGGVSTDYDKAAFWNRKAAEQGDIAAQCMMGMQYQLGYGVPMDYSEAARWTRRAAEQGFWAAYNALGDIYETGGPGLSKDIEEAKRYYRIAADHGVEIAKENLERLER